MADATTDYWQQLRESLPDGVIAGGAYGRSYPVRLPDGRFLLLPLRTLPDGKHAVASLIANQAAFPVVSALAMAMAELARAATPDLIIGLPTLGLAFAPLVAERLAHDRYAPLGYSRKFWYDEALSEPVASITSPGATKRIYLDPNLLPLITGRRVCVVDDAISSGTSVLAVVRLLRRLGVEVASVVVAMKQTTRWSRALLEVDPLLPARIKAVFGCPLFEKQANGWMPVPGSDPAVP